MGGSENVNDYGRRPHIHIVCFCYLIFIQYLLSGSYDACTGLHYGFQHIQGWLHVTIGVRFTRLRM